MKFLLPFVLFLSFAGCPALLPVIDDDHSVGFANEHGVAHLILFHKQHNSDGSSSNSLTTATNEENHEFHLSTSSALIKKLVQASGITKNIVARNKSPFNPLAIRALSVDLFEVDVGSISPSVKVLRI
ncbi:MAG TPA: hypothetical protein VLH08_03335 [Acidobacteriota bacterium]|nr:hypothetical protein [Acidobacteriota bacterium]